MKKQILVFQEIELLKPILRVLDSTIKPKATNVRNPTKKELQKHAKLIAKQRKRND